MDFCFQFVYAWQGIVKVVGQDLDAFVGGNGDGLRVAFEAVLGKEVVCG